MNWLSKSILKSAVETESTPSPIDRLIETDFSLPESWTKEYDYKRWKKNRPVPVKILRDALMSKIPEMVERYFL